MEEQKGLQVNLDDIVNVLGDKLKQSEIDNAYAVAQAKALQKENERLLGVIAELKQTPEAE